MQTLHGCKLKLLWDSQRNMSLGIGSSQRGKDRPPACVLGTRFGRRIPEVTCNGAERGDGSPGSDQISWAQLPAALSPPCDLGEGSVITPCCISAVCPVGTIVLSIWEKKQSPGIGSRRLLGAAVQDSLSLEHLHRVKTVLESWHLHLPCARCAGSAPPPQSLVQVPSACGDPFNYLPLLARLWDQIWPCDNQGSKLVAWAKWSWPATMKDPSEVGEPWVQALHMGPSLFLNCLCLCSQPERINPELNQKGYSVKSDIWSLGITMVG